MKKKTVQCLIVSLLVSMLSGCVRNTGFTQETVCQIDTINSEAMVATTVTDYTRVAKTTPRFPVSSSM